MKILHILTDSNIGGAGRYLLSILESYDREQFQIEVVLPIGSKLAPVVKAADTTVIEMPYIQDRSFSFKAVGALYRLLKEKKPDIVHTHAAFSGRVAAKLLGLRIVHSRHYCIPDGGKNGIMGFVNNHFSHGIIATSPEVEKGLIAAGTKKEIITTIFNGTPSVRSLSKGEKMAVLARYGIPDNAFVVSQIARLDPVKGHDYTLDGAKLLADNTDIVILLAGDGPQEEHLRKRIKEENIRNIIMTGFVPAVEEIINITDLQINASFTETTCLALLEGMSLGVPAVATDGGGNPYVISHGENGLIVPYGSGEALAEAILTIKNDPALYRKMSTAAMDSYNKQFRADIMTRQVEELYRKIRKGL